MKHSLAFIVGLLFALGLCLSGMTNTGKVLGFLDILGSWDISLMFVMIGAIGIHMIAFQFWLKKKNRSFSGETLQLPTKTSFDRKLIIGALLFGAGWGLAGFCPGPALVSLVSLKVEVLIFVFAMFAGMYLCDRLFPAEPPKNLN